jgi:hypothetical protein
MFGKNFRCTIAVVGTWTVRVTLVAELPAARVAGEKAAVYPVGTPVTEKETAAGKVVPPETLTGMV